MLSTTLDTTEQGRFPSFTVGTRSIEVAPLTATSAPSCTTSTWPRPSHDDDLFAEFKTLMLQHKVLFVRDQDITRGEHVAFAERFGPLEDPPGRGQRPGLPGPGEDLQGSGQPGRSSSRTRLHVDGTWRPNPAMGSVLRCIESPTVGGDTIWVNMAEAYRGLPEHIKAQIDGLNARHSFESTFGAAMPIENRHMLHDKYPDAEHPVVRTHPETGQKILFVNAFTTHFTNFHTPKNVRFGLDYTPAASNLLTYLISRSSIPEYQVRWRWTAQQRGHLGQPLHPALRRPGLLARRPEDGTCRDHRHPHLLTLGC